jgi:hypothetical protein
VSAWVLNGVILFRKRSFPLIPYSKTQQNEAAEIFRRKSSASSQPERAARRGAKGGVSSSCTKSDRCEGRFCPRTSRKDLLGGEL